MFVPVLFNPTMTGYTTPAPYEVSASSEYPGDYYAWHVLDGSTSSVWYAATDQNEWVLFDIGSNKMVCQVGIKSTSGASYYPTAFDIETSLDGEEFTVQKSISGAVFLPNVENVYTFDEPVNARYIRVYVVTGKDGFLAIGELFFYEVETTSQEDIYNSITTLSGPAVQSDSYNAIVSLCPFVPQIERYNSIIQMHSGILQEDCFNATVNLAGGGLYLTIPVQWSMLNILYIGCESNIFNFTKTDELPFSDAGGKVS